MNTNPITPITRRTFLKTSAFATGSYLVLTRGTALANTASGSGAGTTTASCGRKWVTRIEVVFDEAYSHPALPVLEDGSIAKSPDKDVDDWSGVVWRGKLKYWYRTCSKGAISAEYESEVINVKSGGYIYRENGVVKSQLKPGSETPWPPGIFDITTHYSSEGTKTAGFNVNNQGAYIRDPSDPNHKFRDSMKIHLQARYNGSSGCIVFVDRQEFEDFVKLMIMTRTPCSTLGKCPRLYSVKLKVMYDKKHIKLPTYTWDRLKMGSPIPATDPQTTPDNPE